MRKSTKWLPAFQRDSLYDLLSIAWHTKCPMPDFISEEEWAALLGRINFVGLSPREGKREVEHLLTLAAKKEELNWVPRREEGESDESYLAHKLFREWEYKTVLSAEAANENKAEIAKAIYKHIMDPAYFAERLFYADDAFILCMQDILKRDEEGPKYAIDWPWKENYALDSFATQGYVHLIERPANRDEECHRRILGLHVTGDVLSLFEKVYTAEFDAKRRQRYLMDKISFMAQDYYDVAPLSLLWEIYQALASEDPCLAGRIGKEEFYTLFPQLVEKGYWVFREEKGETYLMNKGNLDTFEEEVSDENGQVITKEYPFYFLRHELHEANHFDFYIPSTEEAKEYFEYGYWPSRKPYKELLDLMQVIYEEEFSMSQSSFFMMRGEDEPDATCGGYTMDDVYDDVEEKMCYICSSLQGDLDVEDLLTELNDLLVWLTEEAKQKIEDLLIACNEVTNKANLMGYTPLEKPQE